MLSQQCIDLISAPKMMVDLSVLGLSNGCEFDWLCVVRTGFDLWLTGKELTFFAA